MTLKRKTVSELDKFFVHKFDSLSLYSEVGLKLHHLTSESGKDHLLPNAVQSPSL